jgi:glutathione synthase/RimK-type ligase-like ATP-grasp enzyme
MSILIIGAPEEAHAAFIDEKIRARGGHPVYFDTRQFPASLKISLNPDEHAGSLGQLVDGSQTVPLSDIQSVYWRYHMGLKLPPLKEQFLLDMAHREIESTLGSLFRMLDCLWVNSPEAIAMHAYKTYQLQLMHQAGIRIPQTLISNDPDAVVAFYERLNGQVIFKPVRGGAHTETLKPEDLRLHRLKELAKAPVQFQELIEGVDVRVYLVKDELFAGEIRSKTLDFRADPQAEIVPVNLPDSVAEDCRTLARVLGLVFTGIDVRRTPAGEFVFLEGNPCPMFMHFERQSGYPISDRLVDLLMGV